jgi:hypothetical protein
MRAHTHARARVRWSSSNTVALDVRVVNLCNVAAAKSQAMAACVLTGGGEAGDGVSCSQADQAAADSSYATWRREQNLSTH